MEGAEQGDKSRERLHGSEAFQQGNMKYGMLQHRNNLPQCLVTSNHIEQWPKVDLETTNRKSSDHHVQQETPDL